MSERITSDEVVVAFSDESQSTILIHDVSAEVITSYEQHEVEALVSSEKETITTERQITETLETKQQAVEVIEDNVGKQGPEGLVSLEANGYTLTAPVLSPAKVAIGFIGSTIPRLGATELCVFAVKTVVPLSDNDSSSIKNFLFNLGISSNVAGEPIVNMLAIEQAPISEPGNKKTAIAIIINGQAEQSQSIYTANERTVVMALSGSGELFVYGRYGEVGSNQFVKLDLPKFTGELTAYLSHTTPTSPPATEGELLITSAQLSALDLAAPVGMTLHDFDGNSL